MFNQKKQSLGAKPAAKTSGGNTKNVLPNAFVNAALKDSAKTKSGNGSEKFSTSGDAFVDQFTFLGSYKKPRTFAEIEKDCETLWGIDKKKAVMFNSYIRLITRQVSLFDGKSTTVPQKGAELKHEGIMRMIWLHQKDEAIFWNNIGLFISMGSWQDVIKMLQTDLIYHGWENKILNWDKFGKLILAGLNNEHTSELLKKYLPQIKANSACTTVEAQADTMVAKWICSLLFGTKGENSGKTYKAYRKLKTSGTAHEFQQLISQQKFNLLDFNKIHGRALMLMSRSKFLKNQGLEQKYAEWITKPETKDVKYTGFITELFEGIPSRLTQLDVNRRETINKQFTTLVKKGGESEITKFIVVRDTSGSMGSICTGTKMSCYDVAKALALYFSEYLTGSFANNWIEFNSSAKMHTWIGNTPIEKWYNDRSSYVGGTNFQSVINLFCQIKKQGVAETDFPSGVLCISDSEFNPAQLGKTNVETALITLRNAGFSEEYVSNFKIVLWNLQSSCYGRNTGKKFETFGEVPNVFYYSGFSAATISFLTGKIETASELVEAALQQEILQMLVI